MSFEHPKAFICKICKHKVLAEYMLDHILDNHLKDFFIDVSDQNAINRSKLLYDCPICEKVFSSIGDYLKDQDHHKNQAKLELT